MHLAYRGLFFFIIALLVSSVGHAGTPAGASRVTCREYFDHVEQATVLNRILTEPTLDKTRLIRHLSTDPEIRTLFDAPTGIDSMPTIRHHTLRVLENVEEQWPFFQAKLRELRFPEITNLRRVVRLSAALHDIGKGIAIQAGDRSRQLVYTNAILREQLALYGFSDFEIRLGLALIHGPIFGDLAEGKISAEEAVSRLKAKAQYAHIGAYHYAVLRNFFFICDAASYPWLFKRSFERLESGEMVSRFNGFDEVMERLASRP